VVLDGARAEVDAGADVGVGESFGDQDEDVAFALAEQVHPCHVRVLGSACARVAAQQGA
jgi:hypothetical protein